MNFISWLTPLRSFLLVKACLQGLLVTIWYRGTKFPHSKPMLLCKLSRSSYQTWKVTRFLWSNVMAGANVHWSGLELMLRVRTFSFLSKSKKQLDLLGLWPLLGPRIEWKTRGLSQRLLPKLLGRMKYRGKEGELCLQSKAGPKEKELSRHRPLRLDGLRGYSIRQPDCLSRLDYHTH